MSCRSEEGRTVSPSTGKSVKDFLTAAVKTFCKDGKTLELFCELSERGRGNWYAYLDGRCEPKVGILWNAEKISGIQLDDYVPEINAAVRLLGEVDDWSGALTKAAVEVSNVKMTDGVRRGALKHFLVAEELRSSHAMSIYLQHAWWEREGKYGFRRPMQTPTKRRREKPERQADDKVVSQSGKDISQYIQAALDKTGLSQGALSRAIKVNQSSFSGWINGRNEPTAGILKRIEAVSGVSLDEYVPEINRGIELLQNVSKWSDGFVRWKMARFGLNFGEKRLSEAKNGIVNVYGRLVPNMLIRLCRYYEFWTKYGDSAFRMSGEKLPDADEEEQAAFDAYQEIMGNAGVKDFDFHRIQEGLWEFHTERWYRGEIDLNENELRIYYKNGNLSFRRTIHAGA